MVVVRVPGAQVLQLEVLVGKLLAVDRLAFSRVFILYEFTSAHISSHVVAKTIMTGYT